LVDRNFATRDGAWSGWVSAFAEYADERATHHRNTVSATQGSRLGAAGRGRALQTNFLERWRAPGSRRMKIDTVMCTHMHLDTSVGTRVSRKALDPDVPERGVPHRSIEFDHWTKPPAARVRTACRPRRNEVNAASVLPIVDAGLATFVGDDHESATSLG